MKTKKKLKEGASSVKLFKGGLHNMTYKDLKRRAIALGMDFEAAASASVWDLQSYLLNSTNSPDPSLIDGYDDWVDSELAKRGYKKGDALRSPQLRLGYLGENEEGEPVVKKIRGLPKRKSREKTPEGYWKGTKKAYTLELTQKGLDIERIIRRVTKKYPEAKPRTIKSWYRKFKSKNKPTKK